MLTEKIDIFFCILFVCALFMKVSYALIKIKDHFINNIYPWYMIFSLTNFNDLKDLSHGIYSYLEDEKFWNTPVLNIDYLERNDNVSQ